MSRHHHQLHAERWQATRRAVFARDGYRCRRCGKAGRLEAHHEPPLNDGTRNPYDIAGIVTMCRACHIERHRGPRRELTPDEAAWQKLVAELC